jgi:membrane fusion protein, multidrug efflux system
MKKGIRITIWIAVLICSIALIAFTLFSNKKKAATEITKDLQEVPFTVSAAYVTKNTYSEAQTFRGMVEAKSIIYIFSEADGKLINNSIQKGRYVNRGQVLATVDKTIRAATNQLNVAGYEKAKADYEGAKKNTERYETLLTENNASLVETENAKLQLKATEMQLQSLQQQITISKKQIQQTVIKAPASGIIIEKKSFAGDFVQPGTMLGTIADLNTVIVKVYVPETFITKIKPGAKLMMNADVYEGFVFTGTIKNIIPVANEAKAFPVEIEINNNKVQKLMAGMSMSVRFEPLAATMALVIPRTAINGDFKSPYVYVIDAAKKPVKKAITIGKDFGTTVEVLSGLTKDEIVITSGQANVEQGKVMKDFIIEKE